MAYRVLIVDDQEIIRDLVQDALTREGFDMLSASSAEAGLRVLEAETVDVVISD